MLYFHELFASIQGESTDAGLPCVFVRLYGCNIKCAYCDQPQYPKDRKRISVENLLTQIKDLKIKHVCITGGEPLLQPEVYALIYDLVGDNYKVSVETNGCVEIDEDPYNRSFKYIMDVKCPSSGVSEKNIFANLTRLHAVDEVKFVIADHRDYEFAKYVLNKYPTKAKILFSPMFDHEKKQRIGQDLCDWVIVDKLNVRIQIQLHKVLNVQ